MMSGRRPAWRRGLRAALLALGALVLLALPAIEWSDASDGDDDHRDQPVVAGGSDAEAVEHGHAADSPASGDHSGTHGEDTGASGEHPAAHAEGPPELDNIFVMLGFSHGVTWLNGWIGPDQIFMLFYIVILITIAALGTRALTHVPGPLQNGCEAVVEGLDNFIQSILGPRGRSFVPFLGTLFVYILFMNYSGLVPFLRAPTSSINTTLALALCVFVYVQWTGIRSLGIGGYLDHLAGEPRDVVGWALMPLMLMLHVVGELVKPVSLSLRLFGNITGEDVLLAVFVGLGGALYAALHLPLSDYVGIPLQAILYPLLLIFGLIQALVFTLLSTIYFYMMLPHLEEHH